ncbi:MAG: ribosome silencing factor [Lachnospiraceae bacterium]|nr:ribosome silencing factor [Lachnospiraceae bacterium]
MNDKDEQENLRLISDALSEKKGEDIRILDISALSVIADYFLIASGSNPTQIQAMADNVEEKLKDKGKRPLSIEGYAGAAWILMDYGNYVIHIFDRENREFYDLERIWKDARPVTL